MLNRTQVTAICIRHLQTAMTIGRDRLTSDQDRVTLLLEVIGNLANDLDKTLEDAEKSEALGI